jgi:ankyrin repeat protein
MRSTRPKRSSQAEKAIETADPVLLATALLNGVDPNQPEGDTLLHRVCVLDIPVIVKMLLQQGADVNRKTLSGVTPAHIAAENGRSGTLILRGEQEEILTCEAMTVNIPFTRRRGRDIP